MNHKDFEVIDISPPLGPTTAVWPGDTPLTREVLVDISQGSHMDLSTVRSTVHIGAHADAPRHFHRDGVSIDAVDLSVYIGPCVVVTVQAGALIQVTHCQKPIDNGAKRILFRTLSYPDICTFNEDFTAISPEAMEFMGRSGVKLVGIDTPSVDPFHSKDLATHQILHKYKIANVEGLVLDHVSDGDYEFIGLPLRLVGFDASPMRAVLRKLPSR